MDSARIYLVEDEALLVADLRDNLESMGYTICGTAPSGEKALQQIGEFKPDLVFMDIQLKGEMNGIQTAEQVREQFSIPVIYLTAYGDDSFLAEAKITEPFGFLIKPVEIRYLQPAIEMALYKSSMDRERQRLLQELLAAQKEIKTLRDFIPICSNCKSIRDDEGYWSSIEAYLDKHSKSQFSHSICAECAVVLYGDLLGDDIGEIKERPKGNKTDNE